MKRNILRGLAILTGSFNAFVFFLIEYALIVENPLNILNPFIHLQALIWFITIPAIWVSTLILAICLQSMKLMDKKKELA